MPAKLIAQSIIAFASGLAGGGLIAVTTIVAGDTLLLSTPSVGEGCTGVIHGQENASAAPRPSDWVSCVI